MATLFGAIIAVVLVIYAVGQQPTIIILTHSN